MIRMNWGAIAVRLVGDLIGISLASIGLAPLTSLDVDRDQVEPNSFARILQQVAAQLLAHEGIVRLGRAFGQAQQELVHGARLEEGPRPAEELPQGIEPDQLAEVVHSEHLARHRAVALPEGGRRELLRDAGVYGGVVVVPVVVGLGEVVLGA